MKKIGKMVGPGTLVTVKKVCANGMTPMGHTITFELHQDGDSLVTHPQRLDFLSTEARGRREGDTFRIQSAMGEQRFEVTKVERLDKKGQGSDAVLSVVQEVQGLPELTS